MIFDSHSHYDDEAFDEDRDVLLQNLKSKNVDKVVACAASWKSLEKIKKLCGKYDFIYPAYGIHPENGDELTDERRPLLERFIEENRPVAIGEIGLDYHWDEPSKEVQRDIFIYQLELANRYELPVIIHSRDAAEETMEIIKEHMPKKRGVIHCFSGSREMALQYTDMGFYIGVGGVVTFKNGKKLKEVAAAIPMDKLLIETDCPYMAPTPHRGERNDSSLLSFVVDEIAGIRGMEAKEIEEITHRNAKRLFEIE